MTAVVAAAKRSVPSMGCFAIALVNIVSQLSGMCATELAKKAAANLDTMEMAAG